MIVAAPGGTRWSDGSGGSGESSGSRSEDLRPGSAPLVGYGRTSNGDRRETKEISMQYQASDKNGSPFLWVGPGKTPAGKDVLEQPEPI